MTVFKAAILLWAVAAAVVLRVPLTTATTCTPAVVAVPGGGACSGGRGVRTFGGANGETGGAVAALDNDDVLITGATNSFGGAEMLLMRVRSNGTIAWTQSTSIQDVVGLWNNFFSASVSATSASTFHLATGPSSNGVQGIMMTGVDASTGAVAPTYLYTVQPGALPSSAFITGVAGIVTLANDDVVIAGSAYSGAYDPLALRVTSAGAVVWANTMTYAAADQGFSPAALAVAANGDVVIVGTIYASGSQVDAFVTRLSSVDGSEVWSFKWGGSADDNFYNVAVAANGDLVVVGRTTGFGHVGTGSSMVVARLSSAGAAIWVRTFAPGSATHDDAFNFVQFASNGDIVVAGGTASYAPDAQAVPIVARLTSAGVVVWARAWGGAPGDTTSGLTIAPNSGDIIVESSGLSFGRGGGDVQVS